MRFFSRVLPAQLSVLGLLLALSAPSRADQASPADQARARIAAEAQRMKRAQVGALGRRAAADLDADAAKGEPRRGLGHDAIERAVRQHRVEVQGCYDRALGTSGKRLAGQVKFELTVEPSGAVRSVGVTSGEKPGELERCLQRTVRRWQFPAADLPTSLSYVFVFSTDGV